MENDTSFVFIAHLVPEILHFIFSRWLTVAILDLDAKMVSKLYNNNPGRFVMPDLLTIDTFLFF